MARHQAPLTRRCVTCRLWASKLELLRVTRSPMGEVLLDRSGRLPGRGAYVHRSRQCLEGALRTHQLERARRGPLPSDLVGLLATLAAGTPE